jgi:hypothetical protein
MMEAVRTSETSVNFNVTTRRYIPEDSKLHTRRLENLKSHILNMITPYEYMSLEAYQRLGYIKLTFED